MAKAEISWKGKTEEGLKREVYAQHVGREWKFYVRSRKFDQWQDLENPPLEDWLELLDAVRRRAARMLARPEEADRLRKKIREMFPHAEVE